MKIIGQMKYYNGSEILGYMFLKGNINLDQMRLENFIIT